MIRPISYIIFLTFFSCSNLNIKEKIPTNQDIDNSRSTSSLEGILKGLTSGLSTCMKKVNQAANKSRGGMSTFDPVKILHAKEKYETIIRINKLSDHLESLIINGELVEWFLAKNYLNTVEEKIVFFDEFFNLNKMGHIKIEEMTNTPSLSGQNLINFLESFNLKKGITTSQSEQFHTLLFLANRKNPKWHMNLLHKLTGNPEELLTQRIRYLLYFDSGLKRLLGTKFLGETALSNSKLNTEKYVKGTIKIIIKSLLSTISVLLDFTNSGKIGLEDLADDVIKDWSNKPWSEIENKVHNEIKWRTRRKIGVTTISRLFLLAGATAISYITYMQLNSDENHQRNQPLIENNQYKDLGWTHLMMIDEIARNMSRDPSLLDEIIKNSGITKENEEDLAYIDDATNLWINDKKEEISNLNKDAIKNLYDQWKLYIQ